MLCEPPTNEDAMLLLLAYAAGEVAEATDRPEALFALTAMAQAPQGSATAGVYSDLNDVTAMLAGTRLGAGSGTSKVRGWQVQVTD